MRNYYTVLMFQSVLCPLLQCLWYLSICFLALSLKAHIAPVEQRHNTVVQLEKTDSSIQTKFFCQYEGSVHVDVMAICACCDPKPPVAAKTSPQVLCRG